MEEHSSQQLGALAQRQGYLLLALLAIAAQTPPVVGLDPALSPLLLVKAPTELLRPPLFEIEATSLHDAGLQLGRLAGARIRRWLALGEMQWVFKFALGGPGSAAFQELKRINAAAYPEYLEEMRGIAQGASLPDAPVDLDKIWCANLLAELEQLMHKAGWKNHSLHPRLAFGHCSDIYAVAEGGFTKGFFLGHSEDWSTDVAPLYYYVKYTAGPGANFSSCAGLAYPGTLIGWAPTWNAHGMLLTQNTLYPRSAAAQGLSDVFVQREAICGASGARGIDKVVDVLRRARWADGASVNLVDLKQRRMLNLEVAGSKSMVFEVTEVQGNYSHFNMYKNLGPGVTDSPGTTTSSRIRQAFVDTLPAPRTLGDVRRILSEAPVKRATTIAGVVLDGQLGRLDAWCCGHGPTTAPAYSWDLHTFFGPPSDVLLV